MTESVPNHWSRYPEIGRGRAAAPRVLLEGPIGSGAARYISASTLRIASSAISRSTPT